MDSKLWVALALIVILAVALILWRSMQAKADMRTTVPRLARKSVVTYSFYNARKSFIKVTYQEEDGQERNVSINVPMRVDGYLGIAKVGKPLTVYVNPYNQNDVTVNQTLVSNRSSANLAMIWMLAVGIGLTALVVNFLL